jgi:hypothetical protein
MHNEQAVQLPVKLSMLADPGGHTGDVLFSLTVEAFLGTGAALFCAADLWDNPKRSRNDPKITLRLFSSGSCFFLLNDKKPYDIVLSGQLFKQL